MVNETNTHYTLIRLYQLLPTFNLLSCLRILINIALKTLNTCHMPWHDFGCIGNIMGNKTKIEFNNINHFF